MSVSGERVRHIVVELRSGCQDRQVKAALELRNLATAVQNKERIREADGIEVLLHLLDSGHENDLTIVCAETLSCLAADDGATRVSHQICSLCSPVQAFCLIQIIASLDLNM